MPYIDEKTRRIFEKKVPRSVFDFGALCEDSGELNYAITQLIKGYLSSKPMKYAVCNDIIGALEGSKLEFIRRVLVPYEDLKIIENGDVY
jgi:hypothetical protein